jgi:hypothetical protein
MILLYKLLLAHLIGDFILQPSHWVAEKESKKIKAYQLYLHALIHVGLVILIVWETDFVYWAFLLGFIHLTIDIAKIYLQTKQTKRIFFFIDQSAHLLSIAWVYFMYSNSSFSAAFTEVEINYPMLTLAVFLSFPCSIIIKNIITQWTPYSDNRHDNSLQSAGKYIGILERLLVFLFVIINQWEAIGFLIAAKSVFRFGDLKESKDRKLTEYVLIGTLLSFGMAIGAGMFYQFV